MDASASKKLRLPEESWEEFNKIVEALRPRRSANQQIVHLIEEFVKKEKKKTEQASQKKAIPPNRILAGEVARILVQARTGPQISAPFRHERGRRGLSQEGQVFGGRYFPHAPGYTREGADKLAKKSSRISVSFVTPIAPASMLSNASRCCNA